MGIYEPDVYSLLCAHPGVKLAEELQKQGMSRKELATRTGVTEKHISTVINGKKGISPSFAKKLEYALNIPAKGWMNLQAHYERLQLEFEEKSQITNEELRLLKPLKDICKHLIHLNLLKDTDNEIEQILELRRFLKVSSLLYIPNISYNAAYRAQLSSNVNVDPYILYTWQMLCERLAQNINVYNPLDLELLQSKFDELKRLMFVDGDITERLQNIFAECGIAFCVVKHFRGAPVQGFIKRVDGEHLILCLTLRQSRADIFWFTLFHEVCHILNGDMNERFVDFSSIKSDVEAKADAGARAILINNDEYLRFARSRNFTLTAIKRFAASQGIPHHILIGRLQSDELLDWSQFTSEIVYYKWFDN